MSTRKKQFKTESKKMLDMMVNSIYTHKEIFLRELISNASDAIDKRYFRSLTEPDAGLDRSEYAIQIARDKDARTLTLTDNGCGMTVEELENNLGTIARSGSSEFKQENGPAEDISVIGQFGVGFYSAFMVADRVTVRSRAIGAEEANIWESTGADGYTVAPCDYAPVGSEIVLHIKEDTENENYSEFLEEYKLHALIKKYSDYIRYPIKMDVESRKPKEGTGADGKEPEYETVVENQTINSMVPLWHRAPAEISEEEYTNFYTTKFGDYQAPSKVIHFHTDGLVSFEALLFIPAKAPYDYYSKSYEKGLQLYSNGVMIMEKCADLLPDYFGFVRGLIDSPDFTLNISRETLQHDHQLKSIAKYVEKKIKNELVKQLESDREKYEAFYKEFGLQFKYGIYAAYGMNKEELQDLLLFRSSFENKLVTLKEYASRAKEEQKTIYYACAETAEAAALLPQAEAVQKKGFEVLYFTDDVDEFTIQMMREFDGKQFMNVAAENLDISTDEEKETLKKQNEDSKELLEFLKGALGDAVTDVRFTNTLGDHPVCLSSGGGLSTEMEKVLNKLPEGNDSHKAKAETVLEINLDHPVAQALRAAYDADQSKAGDYAKILYAQARMICGLPVENPAELTELISKTIVDAAEK